ncbi:MAG: TetR/AcrR family transcriptional regulator [Ancrocorticia sp.]
MTDNRGRPFDTAVDEAILTTTKALLEAKGFDRLTVSEIVERAGTTRSAFYRRYMSLLDLITDLFLHEFPTELDIEFDTGSLTSDLRAIQVDQQDFFTTPMVYQGLPGFLGKLRADDDARQAFIDRFVQPRRDAVERIVDRAVQRGEITGSYDPDFICDLITGPFIFRIMAPEIGPLDDALVARTVDAALRFLGATGPR